MGPEWGYNITMSCDMTLVTIDRFASPCQFDIVILVGCVRSHDKKDRVSVNGYFNYI